jgi:DNA polymerase-4
MLLDDLTFIDRQSDTMHIDLNSCFASIEQQCNSLLRGRPVVVAAYTSARGCILSPSVEAKRFGIKTGMWVMEAQRLFPDLVVLPTDPWKYRWVNQQLKLLFCRYTNRMQMKSIDEAVLHFGGSGGQPSTADLLEAAGDIKQRIKQDIGDWLTVSIGLAPNRWLAKTAAGLHKPDGLDELNWWNIESVLAGMALEDLHGISRGHARRLRQAGLLQPLDLYRANLEQLRRGFHSILGVQWYIKLRGYECEGWQTPRRSFSHMYSLPYAVTTDDELAAVMSKMVHSLGYRLRRSGYRAGGFFVGLVDDHRNSWFRHSVSPQFQYDTADLYHSIMRLVDQRPERRPVKKVFTGCFRLESHTLTQTTWLEDELRKKRKVEAVDAVQATFGKYAVMPARMIAVHQRGWVKDAISFGGIGELEDAADAELVESEPFADQAALFWEDGSELSGLGGWSS